MALSKRYKPCESFFPHWFPHKNAGTRRRENFFGNIHGNDGGNCRFALGSPNHPNHFNSFYRFWDDLLPSAAKSLMVPCVLMGPHLSLGSLSVSALGMERVSWVVNPLGRFREIMNFRTMHSHSYVDPDSDCKQGDGCLFISVNILSSSQRLVVDLKASPRIVIITISRKVASLCKSASPSSWTLPVCCVVGAPI